MLSVEGLFDSKQFTATGFELGPYLYSRISFLEKEGEVVALLAVEEPFSVVENIYCKTKSGKLLLETGEGTAAISYSGKINDGIYDVELKEGGVSKVTPAASMGFCEAKKGLSISLTRLKRQHYPIHFGMLHCRRI